MVYWFSRGVNMLSEIIVDILTYIKTPLIGERH